MACSLTTAAVVERRKTVTRRLGWRHLLVGEQLCLVRKAMGRRRPDGTVEPLERLAVVTVESVLDVVLGMITPADVEREGFTGWTPEQFVAMFVASHKGAHEASVVKRISWTYDEPSYQAILAAA